jgi:hypothetical protein
MALDAHYDDFGFVPWPNSDIGREFSIAMGEEL